MYAFPCKGWLVGSRCEIVTSQTYKDYIFVVQLKLQASQNNSQCVPSSGQVAKRILYCHIFEQAIISLWLRSASATISTLLHSLQIIYPEGQTNVPLMYHMYMYLAQKSFCFFQFDTCPSNTYECTGVVDFSWKMGSSLRQKVQTHCWKSPGRSISTTPFGKTLGQKGHRFAYFEGFKCNTAISSSKLNPYPTKLWYCYSRL